MKLSTEQLKLVKHEFRMKRIFEPDFRQYSKKLWNEFKLDVWITYKDGEYTSCDTDGWK